MEENDRDAYLRWRERSITQLSTYNNVLIGLAAGGLVLLAPVLLEDPPKELGTRIILAGASLMLLSLAIGLIVMWNRATSFRKTAAIAWARYKREEEKAEKLRQEADDLDGATFRWLSAQGGFFFLSMAFVLGGVLARLYL